MELLGQNVYVFTILECLYPHVLSNMSLNFAILARLVVFFFFFLVLPLHCFIQFLYLLIFLFLAVLGPHCSMQLLCCSICDLSLWHVDRSPAEAPRLSSWTW